jgi:hypothetical protein
MTGPSKDASQVETWTETIESSPVGEYVRSISDALRQEITAAQNAPARAFEVSDGNCLLNREDHHLYEFRAELQIPIPTETPIRLVPPGGDGIPGTLVAVRDFDVILDLREFIGEVVERAKVTSEPWFVTQALRDRLEGELKNSANDIQIPMSLLGLHGMPSREDPAGASLAEEIFRKTGQSHASPNESQLEAIRHCLGSRLHFVWGPPGTGKTTNVAQVVRALVAKGERVLLLAHANAAVDVAILRVARPRELPEGQVLQSNIPLV